MSRSRLENYAIDEIEALPLEDARAHLGALRVDATLPALRIFVQGGEDALYRIHIAEVGHVQLSPWDTFFATS
jgi:hypothetical protein